MIEAMMSVHRCEVCPIRCKGIKQPKSIFARIHRWHQKWWPGWKIYQRDLRNRAVRAAATAD